MRMPTFAFSGLVLLFTTCLPGCPSEPAACATSAECNDGDPCTEDVCSGGVCLDPVGNLCACDVDSDCDDGDACTSDDCDIDHRCQNEPLTTPGCTCTTVLDCRDAEACETVDCVAGSCVSRPVTGCCTVAADCPPGDPCTEPTCVESACGSQPIPGCEACETAASCDDGDACTTDTCGDGACSHVVIPGCGTPTDLTVAVGAGPEGMAVIGLGGAPFTSPFFGLAADAVHVLVAGEDGVSAVNLETEAVTPISAPWAAYDTNCYRAASGDYCAGPGPFGWYVLSTGATLTDASGNATDAIPSPPDASGISSEVLYVQANRLRAASTVFAAPREVAPAAFPGDAFPARPTSAAWLGADTVLVLFENGEVWTAPLAPVGSSPDATRVGDLGGAGASMRYLSCSAASGERVCVASNFGEDTGHVIEIDAAGAVTLGPTFDTGAAPVEMAIHVTTGGHVIASAGFDDDEVRVHLYDGAAVTLEASHTYADCDGPGHCAWIDDETLAVSCNLSDTLKVVGRGLGE